MITLHALTLLSLSQLDMSPMLERGPMVLVEEGAGGKFAQASAVVLIDCPPEKVWELIKAQQNFKDYIPKVLTSEMKPSGTDFEVHMVIDVPGPDTDYHVRYTIDEAWLAAHDSSATVQFDPDSGNSGFAYEEDGEKHTIWLLDAAASKAGVLG